VILQEVNGHFCRSNYLGFHMNCMCCNGGSRREVVEWCQVDLTAVCRCFWSTMAWQRSTVTTEHGSTYRTVRTKTWQARLDMQVSTLTSVLSRVDEMIWSHSVMYWCTSTVAHCHGKDWRWLQSSMLFSRTDELFTLFVSITYTFGMKLICLNKFSRRIAIVASWVYLLLIIIISNVII